MKHPGWFSVAVSVGLIAAAVFFLYAIGTPM